jgi:hypothetical protein
MQDLQLAEKEVAELSIAVKGLLDYYCPALPIPLLLWTNATLTLAAIVSPRLQRVQNEKKLRQEKGEQGSAKPGPAGQGGPALSQGYPTIDQVKK